MAKINFHNSDVRTWVEIDSTAVENNYREFRKLLKKNCLMMGIVKSNAYGHGLLGYSTILDKAGVDWFGVDSFLEARMLRDHGIKKPILVLGYTLAKHYKEAVEKNISLTISNKESLKILQKSSFDCPLRIHLKIDTGMHRQGFDPMEILEVLKTFKNSKCLSLEGVYSHFAAAKNPAFPVETRKQLAQFDGVVKEIEDAGFSPIKHIAATAGTIVFPESHYDLVRVGIGLMGLWPSDETKAIYGSDIDLKPVLTWKTFVSETKKVKRGEGIGYNLVERPRRNTKIAIIPIGYWHGYRRLLSSVGNVLICGHRCRVLGMVSMDMIIADITDLETVKVGDKVTLLGHDGKERVSAEELALYSGTCNYEIITQINPQIRRIYQD